MADRSRSPSGDPGVQAVDGTTMQQAMVAVGIPCVIRNLSESAMGGMLAAEGTATATRLLSSRPLRSWRWIRRPAS